MRIEKALLVALFFSLSGCSVIYEKALEKINPNFFVQQSNLEEKEKELCTDPQYKAYLDKSPCNLTGSNNYFQIIQKLLMSKRLHPKSIEKRFKNIGMKKFLLKRSTPIIWVKESMRLWKVI